MQAINASCPSQLRSSRAGGFTLVEIAIALAVFAFALIGVIMLLGNALQSASETQRDSALANALLTTSSVIRGYPAGTNAATIYFDMQGSQLANTNGAVYKFDLTSKGGAGEPGPIDFWTVSVSAPFPVTNVVGRYLLSRVTN